MTLNEIAGVLHVSSAAEVPDLRVTGVSTDSRTVEVGELFFAIKGERFDGHAFVRAAIERGAAGCIVSRDVPGVPPSVVLRVHDTVRALSELAAHHRDRLKATVVAVTGSNGKTTVKSMIDHVLRTRLRGRCSVKSFNNHIGLPLTLLSAAEDDDYLIVEIGANAPGEVAALARLARPHVGVVTSIGQAHLAGFGSLAGVRAEKLSLFREVVAGGTCVVPSDALAGRADQPERASRAFVTFGAEHDADLRLSDVAGDLTHVRFKLNGAHEGYLPVPGAHNAGNATAAFAVCRRFGLEPQEILDVLRTFQLPDMRLAPIQAGPVFVIDDSYNANPTSMAAAVDLLSGAAARRRVFVVGDMAELGCESRALHEQVGARIVDAGIEMLVAVGREAASVVRGAASRGERVEAVAFRDTDEACEKLPGLLAPGDVVLVKGSRVMGLERLVRRICDVHDPQHCEATV